MSDIVSPRVENYYLHPKKYAWRSDNKSFCPDQKEFSQEDDTITSVIKERFKMVINTNFDIDTVQQNVITQPSKPESPIRTHLSQDAPLDFSVKNSSSPTFADRATTLSESHIKISTTFHQPSESHPNYVNSSVPHTAKLPFLSVPKYNGKAQQSDHRHFDDNLNHQEYSQQFLHPPVSPNHSYKMSLHNLHLHPKAGQQSQFPESISGDDQNSSMYPPRLNSNHHQQEPKGLSSHENSVISPRSSPKVSPRSSPKMSRENSPDDGQYKGSILHEVLAAGTVERSQAQCLSSYLQKLNKTSISTPKPASPNSPLHGTNPTPQTNLMMADGNSILPANGFIPGPNHLMPAAGFALLNSMGYAPNAMNCMNPFANGGLLPPSMDPRLPHTPMTADKKQNKQIRPFKAITNELLYGIPAMGLTPINPVIPNNGYFREYFQGPTKDSPNPPKNSPVNRRESPETSANSAINSSPCSINGIDKPEVPGSGDSNCSYPDASNSVPETGEGSDNGKGRKRTRTLPEELKDEAYWERRRKNNQAAKRSRDARRQKEDMVAQQAWLFREQNMQLRLQLTSLEEQHRCMQIQYRAVTEQCRNLEHQLRLVNEKLARNRCGKSVSRSENDASDGSYGDSSKIA